VRTMTGSHTEDHHPRAYRGDLPASGAWQPGDAFGSRKFASVVTDHPFVFASGGALDELTVAYESWGELNADRSNAVLVCHALTGDSHAAGHSTPDEPEAGWWDVVIGPGKAIDTDQYFVVCANVVGGCQGTTGPASINPETGRPYGPDFPVVTIRDIVRVQSCLADALEIDTWRAVVGGSMGGMQVLEWGLMYPDRVKALGVIASTMAASAQQIAWSAVGRTALALDPRFRGGHYYDAAPGDGPYAGLAIARAIAQITYRTESVLEDRFGRDLIDPSALYGLWDRFQVEGYLDYHGEKLVRRFDANSYLLLNRSMDIHDVGRGRGGLKRAMSRLRAPIVTLGLSTDTLYPPHQQSDIADLVRSQGGTADHFTVDTPHGHDGFLLAVDGVEEALRRTIKFGEG
jgi:homoserine O-acetyltransferase/O-succinyltransferase